MTDSERRSRTIESWYWVSGPAVSGEIDGEPVTTSWVESQWIGDDGNQRISTRTGSTYILGQRRAGW